MLLNQWQRNSKDSGVRKTVSNKLQKLTSKTCNNIWRLKSACYLEILEKILTGGNPNDIRAENVIFLEYKTSMQWSF